MNIQTLGQKLREAREAKFIDVSRVAAETKIMVQIITDMENDSFDRVSAPIYARGFIRSYCSYLGIDSAPLIAEYEEMHNAKIEKKHGFKNGHSDSRSDDKVNFVFEPFQAFLKNIKNQNLLKNRSVWVVGAVSVLLIILVVSVIGGAKKQPDQINISGDQQVDQLIGEPQDVYLIKPGTLETK